MSVTQEPVQLATLSSCSRCGRGLGWFPKKVRYRITRKGVGRRPPRIRGFLSAHRWAWRPLPCYRLPGLCMFRSIICCTISLSSTSFTLLTHGRARGPLAGCALERGPASCLIPSMSHPVDEVPRVRSAVLQTYMTMWLWLCGLPYTRLALSLPYYTAHGSELRAAHSAPCWAADRPRGFLSAH